MTKSQPDKVSSSSNQAITIKQSSNQAIRKLTVDQFLQALDKNISFTKQWQTMKSTAILIEANSSR